MTSRRRWTDKSHRSPDRLARRPTPGADQAGYVIVTSDLKSVDDLDPMTTDHQHHKQVGNGLGPDIIPISDVVKRNVDLVAIDLCVDDNGYPPNGSYS